MSKEGMIRAIFSTASPFVRCLAAFVVCSISFSGWAETFEEIKEMAEQGDAVYQAKLGEMYAFGEGVLQDHKEAVKWLTKAAEQGVVEAQFALSRMYNDGDGVIQDLVKAHVWFNFAGANGMAVGGEMRDSLTKDMTSDQIAEAQKMAREMVEANPKLMGE